MKFFKGLLKVTAAGLVSVAIVCALLCFYSITPVHKENPNGNTDYVWLPNSIWVKATEGISFGRNDANGFNNKAVVDNPDIIVLGSSHMEASHVMQDENAPFLLSQKLEGKYSLYNMGISGHNFFKVCQYIPANLELYDKVPKAVIVETTTVDINKKDADEVVSSSVAYTPSHTTGIISNLQKIPLFRLLYHQFETGLFMPSSLSSENVGELKKDSAANKGDDIKIDETPYDELFSYLKDIEDKYGTQIIIFYHPNEELEYDGGISFNKDEHLNIFDTYANKYKISFIDMTDRFKKMYYEENHVAHGFCTGELASGHLNKYGHAAAADELYDKIIEMEEDGQLCK